MKTLKYTLLALFVALAPQVFGAIPGTDLDDLTLAVREDPENTAKLVEDVVSQYPEDAHLIVNRMLATFPDLASEIILGAIRGLKTDEEEREETIAALVRRAVAFHPALATAIVAGAIGAAPDFEPSIIRAAQLGLSDGPGVIGQAGAPAAPEPDFDSSLVISPSRID